MATRTFLSLAQRLLPSVPGCPQPVLEHYIRDAAIEACEKTLAWRYQQFPIRLTPGVYEYQYDNPAQTEVHAFLTASVNGQPIHPVTLEDIHRRFPDWPNLDPNKQSDPRFVFQLDPDNLSVAPIPDALHTYDLNMVVALKPLRTATGMDKTVFDDLENVIMHGALQPVRCEQIRLLDEVKNLVLFPFLGTEPAVTGTRQYDGVDFFSEEAFGDGAP